MLSPSLTLFLASATKVLGDITPPPALDLAPVRERKVRKPNLHSAILSWLNPLSSIKSRIQK